MLRYPKWGSAWHAPSRRAWTALSAGTVSRPRATTRSRSTLRSAAPRTCCWRPSPEAFACPELAMLLIHEIPATELTVATRILAHLGALAQGGCVALRVGSDVVYLAGRGVVTEVMTP